MSVFYTLVGQDPTPAGMIDKSLVPHASDFLIKGSGGADKFINSNLDQGLKDKGIKAVIVTGTSAQGAVGGTSNGAAQRGYKVVVPVDGMSAKTPTTSNTRPGTSTRAAPPPWSTTRRSRAAI